MTQPIGIVSEAALDHDLMIEPEIQSLIPPLADHERAQLEANVRADGCRDPLVTDQNGLLLDGHNRLVICRAHGIRFRVLRHHVEGREGAKMWVIENQFGRRNLTPYQRAELALRLEPMLAARAKRNLATAQPGVRGGSPLSDLTKAMPVDTRSELARLSGLSTGTIHKVREIADKAPEEVKAALRSGAESIHHAYRDLRDDEHRQRRVEKAQAISAGNGPLVAPTRFPVILADPPWRLNDPGPESRRVEKHYPTMELAKICALPVADIATPDAVLFLWTTSAMLRDAMTVLEAWSFSYVTCMVWVKDKIGTGYYARQQHELLLIAKRGHLPVPKPEHLRSSVIVAPRREHSRKPDEVYAMVEKMFSEYPKCELFARQQREGWWAWGNEAPREVDGVEAEAAPDSAA